MNNFSPNIFKGNILIVDDKPNNLYLLSSMLDEQGYEVRCANSGDMALIAVHTEHPDLILLDVNMPCMNGYEVCKRLKLNQYTREIPIIFLSALGETIDKVRAFQLGGVDYIIKPFQLEEVLARIESQLNLRRMQIELQKAKAEAIKALEQEQELNRLRSEFVAMISHDFRTPLTSIQGFAGLLECGDQIPPLETINRYVNKINLSVDHLLKLLDEILLFGSIELGKTQLNPELVNLREFCRELVDSLKYIAGSQHQIFFSCSATSSATSSPALSSQALVDTKLLQQILINLLSNSLKYSPHKSEIYLDLDIQPEQVFFSVKDQGIGIPSANQSQLFTPFYRSSNVGDIKGTGLGLAIVKKCVEVHQGSISLISQEGVGTTVTVSLPRYLEMR